MSKLERQARELIKNTDFVFSYGSKKLIKDDLRKLADDNPDFENLVFEIGLSYIVKVVKRIIDYGMES